MTKIFDIVKLSRIKQVQRAYIESLYTINFQLFITENNYYISKY